MAYRARLTLVSKRNGFTLIEVLIALTILSVSVLGIIQCISLCSRSATKALRLAEATEIAQREMALAVMNKASGLPAADRDGVYQWQVEKTEKGENLWLISVTVTWNAKGESQVFSLSRILNPGKDGT